MEVKFLHDINKNYMVISLEECVCDDYKLKMIKNRDVSGLLKVKKKVVDLKEKLYYDISSMQSMEVLYEKKHMEIDELKMLILGLENCIKSLKSFLLDFNDIILKPKMVFTDVNSLVYKFCYLPRSKGDFKAELREFMNFVITRIDHGNLEALTKAYELQKITCWENFVIGDLVAVFEFPIKEMEEHEEEKPVTKSDMRDLPIKEKYVNKGILGILAIGICIWGFVFFKTDSIVVKAFIIVIAIVIVLSAFFRYLKISIKNREKTKPSFTEPEDMEEELNEEDDLTTFLGNSDRSRTRFLKSIYNPEMDIKLENLPLILGQSENKSDIVINEKSISRIHARLTQDGREFYIEDLNSTNGTFINGKRLMPYEKAVIDSGDLVGISQITYKFV